MSRSLRRRQEWQFFGALHRAAPGLASAGGCCSCSAACCPAVFAVAHRRAGRRGAGRRLARRPARPFVGIVFVLLAGAHAAAPGGQRQPRQPHRGVALRPADDACDRAAGHRATSRTRPHQRPHRGPRLRPRHHRPAAVDLAWTSSPSGLVELVGGLAVGRRAVRLRLVGAARARRRVALDALAAARERGVARPQHRRGARGAAPRRLRLPPRGRRAGGQGGAAVRARRLGRSTASPTAAGASTSCSGEATRLRERSVVGCLADRARRQRASCSGRIGRRGRRRPARPRPRRSSFAAGRGRHQR